MADYPVQFGPYILERHIASGGMAEVFLAKHTQGQFPGALVVKRMLPEMMKNPDYAVMFRDEASLAMRLNHQNIVRVFDFGEIDGRLYMTMEFVDGVDAGTLNRRLRRKNEALSVPHALRIGIELAAGLNYAHQLKSEAGESLHLIHRDVSPQNILISLNGEVKITDFGIAKAVGRETHTETGLIKGKVQYMAPEQALGQQLDQRVDQFAAGIVVWELLTGQRLFAEKSELLTFEKIIRGTVPKPSSLRPGVPSVVDEAVLRALAKGPQERFPDLGAFARQLLSGLQQLGGHSRADLRPVMNYVLGRAEKLVEAAGNDESAATVYTPAADIGSSGGTGPRPVPHTAPAAAAPSSAISPPSAFGNPVVTPSAPVVRPGSAVKVISAAEAANPSVATGRTSGPPRHGTAQGTGAAGSSAAMSSSGLSLATLPQAAAFPPPGIESIAPQRTAARPGGAAQSQIFNGPAPEAKRPLGLLIGALAVGAVLGFVIAKNTGKPPDDSNGCARPSSSPKDIEAAYELLLKAQMMFEAGDPSGASSKAQEAQTRSGTSRGHYILGTMRLAAGDAAGALAHYRCVLELGPASQEATAIQRLLNNKR